MIIRQLGNTEFDKHMQSWKKKIFPNLVKLVNPGLAFPEGG